MPGEPWPFQQHWTTTWNGESFTYDSTKNHVWVEVVKLRDEMRELRAQFAEMVSLLAEERK